jgi:hypothetical protein
MALTKEAKQEATKKFGKSETDTGSPEVQIAMLTERITQLTEHPADAREGSLLAARPAEARRPAPPVPELPAEEGSRGLPGPHQGARPAPLAP